MAKKSEIKQPEKPEPVDESRKYERLAAAAKASAQNQNVRKSHGQRLDAIKEEDCNNESLPTPNRVNPKPTEPVLHFKEKQQTPAPSKGDIPKSQVANEGGISGLVNKAFE